VRELAPDLFQLRGFPPHAINVYLMGDVLVDAATRRAGRRILRQLRGRDVRAHALTHAHPDHQGASREVCRQLGILFWVGEVDAAAAEDPSLISEGQADVLPNRLIGRFWTGPGHPVDRRLNEGDEVAGFTVLDVPGHSPGHVAYWRESDRVLVAGDVLNSMNVLTGKRGLYEPKPYFTRDPARNRESIRKIAALEPELACFGHGPPWRDPGALREFAAGLD
jgi:glyoxylase-like metal-dependent hydrolase (beta-lactamase superfamily II)